MNPTEPTGDLSPTRQRGIDCDDQRDPDPVTDGGPDHDVPVEEQLTDRHGVALALALLGGLVYLLRRWMGDGNSGGDTDE